MVPREPTPPAQLIVSVSYSIDQSCVVSSKVNFMPRSSVSGVIDSVKVT